jgi:hypothetical protein
MTSNARNSRMRQRARAFIHKARKTVYCFYCAKKTNARAPSAIAYGLVFSYLFKNARTAGLF